jgi:hypothetical protein
MSYNFKNKEVHAFKVSIKTGAAKGSPINQAIKFKQPYKRWKQKMIKIILKIILCK